jgi:hypothetical protein
VTPRRPVKMAVSDITTSVQRLDRHALMMAIWTPALFAAAVLFHAGYLYENNWWFVLSFGALIIAFCGHLIANAVLQTGFTTGETVLGSTLLVAATLAFFAMILVAPDDLVSRLQLPVGLGLGALVVIVAVSMLISFGPRRSFEKFDVVRDNNLRAASRLPHRGGRR